MTFTVVHFADGLEISTHKRPGQGSDKSLIQFCEAQAVHLGLGSVHLYTNAKMTENLSIYPRLGYIEVSRHSEDGFDRVYFEKSLVKT
jgi:hypothetical protein